ncbi:MAG: sulfurtransferase TusA family protein [Deltaproteobacteria bacterium]|nr:sulfurtransferase TusA family protein [Deltaproteobacteria bacterium]
MSEPVLLDITGDVCPMTLVRVRMAMDRVSAGGTIRIRMASGEPISSIPRTLKDEGHEILGVERDGEVFEVSVRKKA